MFIYKNIQKVNMEETNLIMLEELRNIRKLLEILVRGEIYKSLEEIATTNERKKIWHLIDGSRSTEDIANTLNITQRAVQIFLQKLNQENLIEFEKRGYPIRKYDYVPNQWRDL